MRTKILFVILLLLGISACEFPVIETIGCDVSELIDAINDAAAITCRYPDSNGRVAELQPGHERLLPAWSRQAL